MILSLVLVLNNQMDDFATPCEPDYFGVPPAKSNYIAPGKIPLSSMSPTMVLASVNNSTSLGHLVMVLGASGGPKIITAVLNVVLNYFYRGLPLWDSVVAPRVHNQLIYHGSPKTAVENSVVGRVGIRVSDRTRNALQSRGQALLDVDYTGTVQAAAVDIETDRLTAVSDIRKGGAPDGY